MHFWPQRNMLVAARRQYRTFRFFFFLGDGAAASSSGGLTTASGTAAAAAAASAVTRADKALISPRATLACAHVRSRDKGIQLPFPRWRTVNIWSENRLQSSSGLCK